MHSQLPRFLVLHVLLAEYKREPWLTEHCTQFTYAFLCVDWWHITNIQITQIIQSCAVFAVISTTNTSETLNMKENHVHRVSYLVSTQFCFVQSVMPFNHVMFVFFIFLAPDNVLWIVIFQAGVAHDVTKISQLSGLYAW